MVRVGPRFTFKYVIKIPINYVIILSSIRGCQLLLVEQPHLPIPFLPIPSPRTRSSSVKITVPERAPRYRNLPDLQSVPGLKYRRLITSSGSVTPRQLHASTYFAHTVTSTSLCMQHCLRTSYFIFSALPRPPSCRADTISARPAIT